MLRLACLVVPLFPLAARLRAEPELRSEGVAILAGNGNAARVLAATRVARRAGVRPGMSLPQARALLPKLVARGRDAECERAAQEALLEVAETFSPRAEDGGEGIVWLDVSGCERRFRGQLPERDLGLALMRAAERAGLPVGAGIAGSKLAARVAAGLAGSPTVVPPAAEPAFLAPLPLARLAPEIELAERLERWGLRSIGDLARLPAAAVASRLGEAGERLLARARGRDDQPLVPREPPPEFREGMELEWPLATLEPFLFIARAALDRLCRRLDAQGLGCTRLEVALRLEPAGHDERAIALPAPTRDVKTLLTLVRLSLEERPPGAALSGFAFLAHPDRPRAAQLALFGPPALSPDRLATALARLFGLLGPDRVGSPHPLDGHRPERFALEPYAPPPPPEIAPAPRASRGLLAVRTLRPPVRLEVQVRGEPGELGAAPVELRTEETSRDTADGDRQVVAAEVREPDAFPESRAIGVRKNGAVCSAGDPSRPSAPARPPKIAGPVRVASGPWQLEEGWWSDQPVEREYWDVELERGGIVRIYREAASGEWFADGVYD